MALKRTLTAGWHLSDGILNTFPLGESRDVLTAAAEASFAPNPLRGMNLMAAEWVYNRRWRYESHFDAPTEDDQQVWLLFERLCGAGEVVVNSIDTDGVKQGFDLEMLAAVCGVVQVPVIASGGAGRIEDFITLFRELPGVDAGLAASIFHFGEVAIKDLKEEMARAGIPARII